MRLIQNIPIYGPDGQPYKLLESKLDTDGQTIDVEATPDLAKWLSLLLGRLPTHRLTQASDAYKLWRAMEACHNAKDSIDLTDEDYIWLKKMLFDDEMGTQLLVDSQGKPTTKGSFAFSTIGLRAVAMERAITAMQAAGPEVSEEPVPIKKVGAK